MKGPSVLNQYFVLEDNWAGNEGIFCVCILQAITLLQVIKGLAKGESSLGMKLYKFITFKLTLYFLSVPLPSWDVYTTTAIEQQEHIWAAILACSTQTGGTNCHMQ